MSESCMWFVVFYAFLVNAKIPDMAYIGIYSVKCCTLFRNVAKHKSKHNLFGTLSSEGELGSMRVDLDAILHHDWLWAKGA